jgi:predicted amidohydrolase
VHEYAKVYAGRDEKRYCRGGDKLSLFQIDGVWCTLVICRDAGTPSSIAFQLWPAHRSSSAVVQL